jgi:predicted permease
MDIRRRAQVLRLRLRSLLRWNTVEHEVAEEISFHLEERARELVERRAFGGVEQRKEECRDARRLVVFENVVQDTRYALRMMRRTPAFSTVAIGSLALGIGATVAIFTIFDTVVLKPLPVAAPNELRLANQSIQVNGRERKSGTMFPYRCFQDIRSDLSVFSDVLAFAMLDDAVIRSDGRELTANGGVLFVSNNYFATLAVEPEAGRLFSPADDDAASALSFAVLGERFWRRELNGDTSVIGRSLVVDDAVFTIAGVSNRTFYGLTVGRVPDVYLPLESMASVQPSVAALADRRNWRVQVVGRLKPGIADSVATDRLTHVTRALEPLNAAQPPPIIQVLPLDTGLSSLRAQFMEPLSLLMGMVGLLLIVACVNVATMLQARASARKQEIVLRVAIGAGHARILQQLAAESIVLIGIATAFGLRTSRVPNSESSRLFAMPRTTRCATSQQQPSLFRIRPRVAAA